ncbi:MAG TPA: HAD-IB family hydrolase [Propionibacteriaceae bacterium]|nr:HAD-IB family hydrolase [Propionibacteriaceae bacterium]
MSGPESTMSNSEQAPVEQVGHVESLPGSDASAIPVDQESPLSAAGPLQEAPEELEEVAARQEPLIREDPTAAAFFDLDNTVIQGASLFHLAKGLYRRGFFPTRVILKGLWVQVYFRLVGREKAGHIDDARSVTLGFIEGHTVEELAEIASEVYEESIAERIWPGTRALAQMHLDVGQQVWLVTAAPVEVAGIIAARLGLTGALGTTAEHIDGVYTGRLKGDLLHGPAKAQAIRALAHEHGLDLAHCFAYSDSYNDLPMLSLVGHPCAINPDGRLLSHAEEQDWQIQDYRSGRKAARLGLLGAGAAGATAGAVATGLAVRRIFRG